MFDAFYSDPHFFHKNIISFCDRPFSDLDQMHERLIQRYNEVVEPDHIVLWCGDVSFGSASATSELLQRMNGRKALVRGNHDKGIGTMIGMGFEFVVDELFLRFGPRVVRVCHYPYALTEHQVAELKAKGQHIDDRYPDRRPPRIQGQVLIHGHTHSIRKFDANAIHVGVDAWDYKPATWNQVAELISRI